MAHVAKYDRASVVRMIEHYERSKTSLGDHIKTDRTRFNYVLQDRFETRSALQKIQERLAEVRCQNRKDVKVLCDWVVTLPKVFQEKHPDSKFEKAFFKATYQFFCNRYGHQNVIGGFVHKDEAQPHMHCAFIPVVADRRRGGEKVSAKELLNREELRKFHSDLEVYLSNTLRIPVQEIGIMNEATREGNRSIAELKRQSAADRLHQVQEQGRQIVQEAQEGAELARRELLTARAENVTLRTQNRDLKAKNDILEARVTELDQALAAAREAIMARKPKKRLFREPAVVVPPKEWESVTGRAVLNSELGTLRLRDEAVEIKKMADEYADIRQKQADDLLSDAQNQSRTLLEDAQSRSRDIREKAAEVQLAAVRKDFPELFSKSGAYQGRDWPERQRIRDRGRDRGR